MLVSGVVGVGTRTAEPDGPLAGVVADAEEEVGLAERPRRGRRCPGPLTFLAAH
jgi:hypothetical protein